MFRNLFERCKITTQTITVTRASSPFADEETEAQRCYKSCSKAPRLVNRKSWLPTALTAPVLRGAAEVGATWVRSGAGSTQPGGAGSDLGQGRQTESFCGGLDNMWFLLSTEQQETHWDSPIQKHILEHTTTGLVLLPKVREMSKKEAGRTGDIRPGRVTLKASLLPRTRRGGLGN